MEKESDSIDYGFISKYIKDDINEAEGNLFKKKFEIKKSGGATEVLSNIGAESFSQNNNNNNNNNNRFKNRYNDSNISGQDYGNEEIEIDIPEEIESKSSSPVSEAKKEFLEQMQDESLSLDSAARITHDWGK